jgi:hypothetical protein
MAASIPVHRPRRSSRAVTSWPSRHPTGRGAAQAEGAEANGFDQKRARRQNRASKRTLAWRKFTRRKDGDTLKRSHAPVPRSDQIKSKEAIADWRYQSAAPRSQMSAANENLDPAQPLKHTIGSLSVRTCDLTERAATHLTSPGGQRGFGFAHSLAIGAPVGIKLRTRILLKLLYN